MAEFSNLGCFQVEEKVEEMIKTIINDEFKFADETDGRITTIPILSLMWQMPYLPMYLPPLQIPLEGKMSSCVKGLSKNQDFVVTGKKGEEYFWIVCCDGVCNCLKNHSFTSLRW